MATPSSSKHPKRRTALVHPAHVAEFVAGEVEELRRRAAQTDLPVTAIELEGDVSLYVGLEVVRHGRLSTRNADGSMPVGAGLITTEGFAFENVLDLSARAEKVSWWLLCDLADFDSQAPTAELLRADRTPLPPQEWPADVKNGGIVDSHPQWHRPWFCRPGFREYHTHLEHEDRPWDEIRGDGTPLHGLVLGLVADLADRFVL